MSSKTLQVFNCYQFYGGEEDTVRLLDDLYDDDFMSLFFHSKDWANESKWKKLSQPLRAFYNKKSVLSLRELQSDHQFDAWLFHNIFPVGSLGLYAEAGRENIPIITYLHNFRPYSLNGLCYSNGKVLNDGFVGDFSDEINENAYRGSNLQSRYMAVVMKRVQKLYVNKVIKGWISQTHFMKKKFVDLAGIDPAAIEVILPPRVLKNKLTKYIDKGYVLFIGRLTEEKGVDFLLDIWKSNPSLPRLVLIGTGELENKVIKAAEDLENLDYAGWVEEDQKKKLIEECSCVVIPSLWMEVLGLVTFEAYEFGKPVIAANAGGLTETVREGETGFLHEPGDKESFIEALNNMMDEPEENRQFMGMNGRVWLEEETCPIQWKIKYNKFVDKIVSKNL